MRGEEGVCGAGAGWVLGTALMVCFALVKSRPSEPAETEAEIAIEGLGRL